MDWNGAWPKRKRPSPRDETAALAPDPDVGGVDCRARGACLLAACGAWSRWSRRLDAGPARGLSLEVVWFGGLACHIGRSGICRAGPAAVSVAQTGRGRGADGSAMPGHPLAALADTQALAKATWDQRPCGGRTGPDGRACGAGEDGGTGFAPGVTGCVRLALYRAVGIDGGADLRIGLAGWQRG